MIDAAASAAAAVYFFSMMLQRARDRAPRQQDVFRAKEHQR